MKADMKTMRVTLNDETIEVDEQTTVATLLQQRSLQEKGIAAAADWSMLQRARWDTTLTDGARIEVVTAVQGG